MDQACDNPGMNNAHLLRLFHDGNPSAFGKAWDPAQRFSGGMPRSWMGWLLREAGQRQDKQPGDLIPGGIKGDGAPDAEIGPFLDVVVGRSPELLYEPGLASWLGMAKTDREIRARAERIAGIMDGVIPGKSRAEASKLLGVYLRDNLPGPARKIFLDVLSVERLTRWNPKALLRPEFLLDHSGWTMGGETDVQWGTDLIDATLDRLGDVARFVRTDIVPVELVKMFENLRPDNGKQRIAAHLLTRIMPLFKPDIQATVQGALRVPQVNDYTQTPTPSGLAKLAAMDPSLDYESKRDYNSVGAVTVRAYANAALMHGEASAAAIQWADAINALQPQARASICAHLDEAIEDVIDAQVDREGKTTLAQQMQKALPAVRALRALDPDAPLARRSWAELAVSGDLAAQIQATPALSQGNKPKRK